MLAKCGTNCQSPKAEAINKYLRKGRCRSKDQCHVKPLFLARAGGISSATAFLSDEGQIWPPLGCGYQQNQFSKINKSNSISQPNLFLYRLLSKGILFNLLNVFVQLIKCIFPTYKMYLSKSNIGICPNWKSDSILDQLPSKGFSVTSQSVSHRLWPISFLPHRSVINLIELEKNPCWVFKFIFRARRLRSPNPSFRCCTKLPWAMISSVWSDLNNCHSADKRYSDCKYPIWQSCTWGWWIVIKRMMMMMMMMMVMLLLMMVMMKMMIWCKDEYQQTNYQLECCQGIRWHFVQWFNYFHFSKMVPFCEKARMFQIGNIIFALNYLSLQTVSSWCLVVKH